MAGSQNGHVAHGHPEICQPLPRVHKRYEEKVYPMQQLIRNKEKKFEWIEKAQDVSENITVLRSIAFGSKVLSDTGIKYGAPKSERLAFVTFVKRTAKTLERSL